MRRRMTNRSERVTMRERRVLAMTVLAAIGVPVGVAMYVHARTATLADELRRRRGCPRASVGWMRI